MKNRFFPAMVAILLVLAFVVTACGGNTASEPPANTGSGTANETPTESPKQVNLKVAANNTQTSWYMFTAALGNLMADAQPVKATMEIFPYAGGVGNAELLTNKEADFGLLFNITAKWAHDGVVAYETAHPDLRGIAGGLNQYYIGIVARTEFLEKNGIKSVADIAEKKIPVRVITNPVGSLAEYNTRQVLEAYGLSYDKIKEFGGSVELTSNDVIKSTFQNGTADLHVLAMTKAHPVITEMALQTDVTLLPMEDNIREWFAQYGYENIDFPAGEFKGQDADVPSVGFVASYYAHKDLDEDTAYTLAKVINENKDALVQGHSSVSDFDPAKAGNEEMLGVPLHPGAEKYYKEAGLIQ